MAIPNLKPYIGKYVGDPTRGDILYKITDAGLQEERAAGQSGYLGKVDPQELEYLKTGGASGSLTGRFATTYFPTHEQQFGTAAAKAAGQPYTAPGGQPTYAEKFYKESGRFPTREEMIGAGVPVAQPTTQPAAKYYGTELTLPSGQRISPLDPNYAEYAKQYGTAEVPPAGETPIKPAAPEAYKEEKSYTLPDGTKLNTQQMIDMLSGKGYEEAAPIDRAAKRKELATTAGLDKTMTEINEMDKQINEVEAAIRNRSEDLRARLRDTDATESEIQRELTTQLRPFDRKYRDLMAIRGVKAEVYNRGMTNVNQEISDLEAGRAEKISAQERKTNLMLKAYGLKTAEEEKAEKRNQWIVEQAQKLESGKTLTMPDGTKIVGAKAKDPDTLEYTYTDAAANKQYKVVVDKNTKKETGRYDMGVAYKEGAGTKKTQAEVLQADVKSLVNMIETGKDPDGGGPFLGDDGFISPKNYNLARKAWVSKGYKAKDFDSYFSVYINPANISDYTLKAGDWLKDEENK